MGYETRLYIVEKHTKTIVNWITGEEIKLKGEIINGKEMFYSSLIAFFDLCKCYDVSNAMREYPATEEYFYAEDGNAQIIEDKYGELLKEIPLEDAIEIIEEAAEGDNYRRFAPCLTLLKAFEKDKDKWNEIVVLHYGY